MVNKARKRLKEKLKLCTFDETETQRYYRNVQNKKRYQRVLSSTLTKDTGFDVVCCSCLQYKNKAYCKELIGELIEKTNKFVIKMCSLLKNRTDGRFVCNVCLNDIKKNKVPKRSHINSFKYGSFPRSFILNLKQKCKFKEQNTEKSFTQETENYDRDK